MNWKDLGALFTPSEKTKLAGIEDSATTDQTNTEIRDAVEAATDSNTFKDADHTKLNGIASGADVTGSNAPQAHGAGSHTDRTRKIFISRANPMSTGGANNYSITLDASTDETAIYNFKLPEDFVSLTSAKVVYVPAFGTGLPKTVIFDSLINFGGVGEMYNTHSTNTDGTSETIDDGNIDTITLPSAAFTGITKDDYIFIEIKRDADNVSDDLPFDWGVMGIEIEYMADM